MGRLPVPRRISYRSIAPGRVELPTSGLGNRCSIRLSYGAADRFYQARDEITLSQQNFDRNSALREKLRGKGLGAMELANVPIGVLTQVRMDPNAGILHVQAY